VSAVTQNQPLKVEIKGFKTSHFLEQKTAPQDRADAGPMGHVARPESEFELEEYFADGIRGSAQRRDPRFFGALQFMQALADCSLTKLRHKKDSFSITVMVRDEKTSIRFGCFPKGLIHSGDSAAATERRE
jgi:hypothetical protein